MLPNWLLPPLMQTHDGVITSLGDLVPLARRAGAGARRRHLPDDRRGRCADRRRRAPSTGIVTGDLGVDRDGKPKPGFAAGIGIRAKYTLIGEGARGSLAKQLIQRFSLDAQVRAAEIRTRHQGDLADPGLAA